MFILNEEEGQEEEVIMVEVEEEVVELKNLEVPTGIKIELRTTVGFSVKGTMKLRGSVKGKEIVVLIDIEATHNFIHQTLVDELGLINVE